MVVSTVLAHPPTKDLVFTPSTFAVFVFGMPPSHLVRVSSNDGTYFQRNMRTFNINLFVVLSCIAMIGATPIGYGAPAEDISRRQLYVP